MSWERRFSKVYGRKLWASGGVLSGHGSRAENCGAEIAWLEECARKGLRSVLDLGCGDLEWVSHCDAILRGELDYEGWDVVPSMIEHHRRVFPWFRGRVMDIEEIPVLTADIIILKDVLFHHCNGFAEQILMNLSSRHWRRLLITSHPGADNSRRRGLRKDGAWSPYDVEATGLLRLAPVARLPRPEGGCQLIYHAD